MTMKLHIECGSCMLRVDFESDVKRVTFFEPTKQEMMGVLLPPGWQLQGTRFNCGYCVARFRELEERETEALEEQYKTELAAGRDALEKLNRQRKGESKIPKLCAFHAVGPCVRGCFLVDSCECQVCAVTPSGISE